MSEIAEDDWDERSQRLRAWLARLAVLQEQLAVRAAQRPSRLSFRSSRGLPALAVVGDDGTVPTPAETPPARLAEVIPFRRPCGD